MDLLSLLHLPVTAAVFYALPFLAALMVIVFIHEFGHFIVARWCGVTIEAFSIGFGREITGWYDRHGTRWKLSWIPLGGYVKFLGDANPASMPDANVAPDVMRDPGNFHTKPVWQRAAVVAAGPVANFILAIVIFTCGYAFVGLPYQPPLVAEVLQGSAAMKAGIVAGDMIVSIDGRKIKRFPDIQEAMLFSDGEVLAIVVERKGSELKFQITPQEMQETDAYGRVSKAALLGVKSPGPDAVLIERLPLPEAGAKAFERTGHMIFTTLEYIGRIFTGKENGSQIGSVIKIASITHDAASAGPFEFVLIIGFISVSIGLINLFPIPMLDGGHLVFYAIEAVLGRPLGANAQEWGFRIGFSLVIMLMAVGLLNDIGWITK